MNKELSKLDAELEAIELWDSIYHCEKTHDEVDEVSYQTRQERRREIIQEVQALATRPALGRQRQSS
jgi:hypothetical protein